ncbi:MAG: DUF402 domain-containing protein [Pyrinomonadaceae bacterium]
MLKNSASIVVKNFDGSVRKTWKCKLLEQTCTLVTFVGEFFEDVSHAELGLIRQGTLSYEYYWLGRWYNVFRFCEPDGSLRNYYCNVNMPPIYDGNMLEYVDLDLDLLVWPDGSYQVLDRDEFEANSLRFEYPFEVRANAESALVELIQMAETGDFGI